MTFEVSYAEPIRGPVPEWAAYVTIGSVFAGALIAEWIARRDLVVNSENSGDAEQAEMSAASAAAKQVLIRPGLDEGEKKDLYDPRHASDDPVLEHNIQRFWGFRKLFQNMYSESTFGTVRERFPFPWWVGRLGGYRRGLLLLGAFLYAMMYICAFDRKLNLFEMVKLNPGSLKEKTFAYDLYQAKRKGEHLFDEYDWPKEDVDKAFQILQDANDRWKYNLYNTLDCEVNTIGGLLYSTRYTFYYYGAYFVCFAALCSVSARFGNAVSSSGTLLGILLFLDLSVSIDTTDVLEIENSHFEPLPRWNTMTSFERQLYIRWYVVPITLIGCLFYSSHTYVDYEEHSLEHILSLALRQEEVFFSMKGIVAACKNRQLDMETKTGGLRKPAAQNLNSSNIRLRLSARAKAQAEAAAIEQTLELPAARKLDFNDVPAPSDQGSSSSVTPTKKTGGKKKKKRN